MRVGLLVNPTAGGGRGAGLGLEAAELLRRSGHETEDLSSVSAADARAKARAALHRLDVLAVLGGDGMVHLGAGLCAGGQVPLAILACGTGNDVARALALPVHDGAASVEVVNTGFVRRVDLARLDGERRWFAGVLGAGFDSLVNERANRMRRPRGPMRYNLAIARELPLFRPIPYVIEVDGQRRHTEAMLVAVANGPSYGGGMRVCPDARMDDGLLDVLVVHRISTVEFLRVFPTVFRGAHVSHPAVEILRGRHVHLAAHGIVAYADGERFAPLPLSVSVDPAALPVLVPRP